MIISGVYKLTCIPTKQIYIGSSINIIQRWYEITRKDIYGLYSETSYNLRQAFVNYGVDAFTFQIIELATPDQLSIKELYWINLTECYKPEIGFNTHCATNGRNNRRIKQPIKILPKAFNKFGIIALSELARLTQD